MTSSSPPAKWRPLECLEEKTREKDVPADPQLDRLLGRMDRNPTGITTSAAQNVTFVGLQRDVDTQYMTGSKMYEVLAALKRMAWIVPLAYTYLWTAAIFAMFPPFYPGLATSRGLEAWKFGFVFSALKCGMSLGSFSIRKMGTMEAIYGIGNMIGSVTGGALIDLWAFPLPFFVVGVVQALSSPFVAIYGIIPKERPQDSAPKARIMQKIEGAKFWFLLTDPEFLVCAISFAFNWILMGFNQTTLEPHLSQFQLSSTHLGEIYMVQSAGYVIASVLSAIFCNMQKERSFLFVCHVMAVVAYLIVGPIPYIPISPNLWMAGSAQLGIGIATSAYFVCSSCLLNTTALSRGCPDNLQTTSFVSSVTFGCAVLCACITAPTAGYVSGTYGYRTASMVLFGVLFAWTPVLLILWLRPSLLRGSKRFRYPSQENYM
ncbi:MFS-type transporter SLC18B1 isoform X2 [Ixodes scapularis]|uniref:MFS-type transporter SLC18B1 isoform X2 n=1 Tax=Ixodes scapularis TaxID=6945 RepID=UPI001C380631|nr:MFS-type transporter SLC18B1 isoform X2 [Ixodes scapularis]